MVSKYSTEFKLHVVRTYLSSPFGIRVVARSLGLPSKNYLTRWMQELTQKGLLTKEEIAAIEQKTSYQTKNRPAVKSMHEMSPSEKQLAEENLRLKAEVDFLRTLVSLDDLKSKKK